MAFTFIHTIIDILPHRNECKDSLAKAVRERTGIP